MKKVVSPLFIQGLIFFLVNVSTSHMFYQVNTYKIVLVILGVTLLTVIPSKTDFNIPWRIWCVISVPLIATFPGLIWYGGAFNYSFRYELATNLVLILWLIYLYHNTRHEKDLNILLIFISLTVIYASCYAILIGAERAKATFGNANYFAGFLIIVLPILLTQALPNSENKLINLFYGIAFILGTIALLLTQTRAAIVAFLISLILVGFLYCTQILKKYRLRILILISCIIITILSIGQRFTELLTSQAWLSRIKPWEVAITSIKASPIIGYGLGSSYNLYFLFRDPKRSSRSYNHVHSEILEYLQEGGLVGLIIFILFWSYLIYLLVKLLRNPKTSLIQLRLGIGITGSLLAYHIHSSVSLSARMMVVKLPLYTLIGLVLVLNKLRNR